MRDLSCVFFFVFFFHSGTSAKASNTDSLKLKIFDLEMGVQTFQRDTLLINDLLLYSWLIKDRNIDSAIYSVGKIEPIINRYLEKTNHPFEQKLLKGIIGQQAPNYITWFFCASARVYNTIGVYYDLKGDYNQAIDSYKKAIEIWDALERKKWKKTEKLILANKSKVVGNLGVIYEQIEEYDLALDLYYYSLSLSEELNDTVAMAINLSNIGGVYYQQNLLDDALKSYEDALGLMQFLNNQAGVGQNLNNIGLIYSQRDSFLQALNCFQEALKIDERLERKNGIALKKGNIGALYIKMRDFKNAERYLLDALTISKELGSVSLQRDHLEFLSNLYTATGDFEKANTYLKEYIIFRDSIQNERNIEERVLLKASYEFEKIQASNESKRQAEADLFYAEKRKQNLVLIFLIIFLVMLLILSFGGYYFLQNARKRQLVMAEKRQLEIEYKLLRTQMNPHFIFNALNSINAYIVQDNSENASKLLNKFSKLIRTILHQSTKEKVSIADELEQIKTYVEIEQMRYSYKFEMQLIIDQRLNVEVALIPTMVLQPFVENAILHGLSSVQNRKGLLKIEIKLVELHFLIVTIEDNGIGRVKKDQVAKNKSHESLSLKLIEERLALLNTNFLENIMIEDLNQGTRVQVRIPVEYEF